MIAHFNLSGSDNSFYFEISKIQQESCGLKIVGIVGDGSAEAWFEASVGEQLRVCVLPVWDGDSDSFCQRYEQSLVEQGLSDCLEEVRFHSEKTFNPATGCWQQKIIALPKQTPNSLWAMARTERPHHQVCEKGVIWQRQAAC